jgi:hypothetical protein
MHNGTTYTVYISLTYYAAAYVGGWVIGMRLRSRTLYKGNSSVCQRWEKSSDRSLVPIEKR